MIVFEFRFKYVHLFLIESLSAIVDSFRIALQNSGNNHVKFTNDGQMKRRKSRTHALDIPSGMQRNLSESQLVQVGSKAVSNVAVQFTKLGHSLNPKILTGKKTTSTSSNNSIPTSGEETAMKNDANVIQDGEICNSAVSCNESTGSFESTNKYNDNSFMEGVGIVMVDSAELAETQNQSEPRKSNTNKNLENVARISISTVCDNVKLPPEMLDINDLPDKSIPTPEINVQETDDGKRDKNNGLKMCHSVADMRTTDSAEDDTRYGCIIKKSIHFKFQIFSNKNYFSLVCRSIEI